MLPTRRQLKSLIEEIRREDIFLDQAGDAILSRWEDDDDALDALKDILARAEKANGLTNVFDADALSAAVHEDLGCGWMDEQVAAIASMALQCEIGPEQVRNTRRR